MRKRADGFVGHNAAMVEDFFELGGGFPALMGFQICFSTHINGIERGHESGIAWLPKLEGSCNVESFDGFRKTMVVDGKLGADCWQVIEFHDGVLRKTLSETFCEFLCPHHFSGERQS